MSKIRVNTSFKFALSSSLIGYGLFVASLASAATPLACNSLVANTPGFYGAYYNLSSSDPGMHAKTVPDQSNPLVATQNPWYQNKYFRFDRVDTDLQFGKEFFPLDENLPGDPFNFAVNWHAKVVVPSNGVYTFSTVSNDDSWVLIDNKLVVNNGGIHGATRKSGQVTLTAGEHIIDIYFAERAPRYAVFNFSSDKDLTYYARPITCDRNGLDLSGNNPPGGEPNGEPNGRSGGRVLGESTTAYTPVTALYQAQGTPDIYAIYSNGRKHLISGPTAFTKYGYKYSDIKIVPAKVLAEYPDVQLVRTPEDSTIFFLSARANKQWLKIPLLTPTVFVSYANNYWGDVVVIDELDLNTYQSVELVKLKNSQTIYLLRDKKRHEFLSSEILLGLGYNPYEAMVITPTHLDSFVLDEPLG